MRYLKKDDRSMYGLDALSLALVLIVLALNLISLINPDGFGRYLGLIAYIPLILAVFRSVSRNHEARQKENQLFLSLVDSRKEESDEKAEERKQKKIFRFFSCPECRQKIRVPKGKGRVEITCPKCNCRFIKKT